jgi:hypothetical protein
VSEYPLDNIAYQVFAPELRKVATKAAREALGDVDLEEILESVLPGLGDEVREQIIESGLYMVDRGAHYMNVAHPSDRHWEGEMSADAMEMRF